MTALPLDRIRTDGGTQPRDHIDELVVARYVEDLEAGAEFPPIVAFFDGTDYWLADGFHRWRAHRAAEPKRETILADIRQGTQRDAVLFSVGANATHGYARTNADKRRAALKLLHDSEWGMWSDREIARLCAVTHPFVSRIRAEIAPPPADTGNGFQYPQQRTFTHPKTGTATQMNVGRIGSNPAPRAPSPPPPFVRSEAPEPQAPRRPAAFPPAHAPIAGRIAWLMKQMAETLTIEPHEFAVATTYAREDLRQWAETIAGWIADLDLEPTYETD